MMDGAMGGKLLQFGVSVWCWGVKSIAKAYIEKLDTMEAHFGKDELPRATRSCGILQLIQVKHHGSNVCHEVQ